MNNVNLIGRLTRDPEVRYSQGAEPIAIARWSLAVDRRRKQDSDQNADFIPCVAFGKLGEIAEKYLRQGSKIAVNGRIQTGSYTNKDGIKVYTFEVVVDQLEFCESKKNSNEQNNNQADRPVPSSASTDGFMSIPEGIEDDLPFK